MASGEPAYALRLCEDMLLASGRCALGALNRVLYVRRGALAVGTDSREVAVTADHAWHGVHACEIVAGDTGSTVLRYELIRGAAPLGGVPGGVALPHRHRGGGIRCLIAGALDVTVGQTPARRVTPGGAWFESGREPVLAVASKDEPTSFIRVAILPREIRGRTSIMYVDPNDAERGRPRTYTVYVDAPIAIV